MADDVERVQHKLWSRVATFVIREATERGMHPLDFAEVFADALMTTVMARLVTKNAEAQEHGGC